MPYFNMVQTELTNSLRQNLLRERQQNNSTVNAVNKRQQSAVSIVKPRQATGFDAFPQQIIKQSATFAEITKNNNLYDAVFDQGLHEYHERGW
jgi:DUF438 domain-containing protein